MTALCVSTLGSVLLPDLLWHWQDDFSWKKVSSSLRIFPALEVSFPLSLTCQRCRPPSGLKRMLKRCASRREPGPAAAQWLSTQVGMWKAEFSHTRLRPKVQTTGRVWSGVDKILYLLDFLYKFRSKCLKKITCCILIQWFGANKRGYSKSSKVIGWRSVLSWGSSGKRTSRKTERENRLCFLESGFGLLTGPNSLSRILCSFQKDPGGRRKHGSQEPNFPNIRVNLAKLPQIFCTFGKLNAETTLALLQIRGGWLTFCRGQMSSHFDRSLTTSSWNIDKCKEKQMFQELPPLENLQVCSIKNTESQMTALARDHYKHASIVAASSSNKRSSSSLWKAFLTAAEEVFINSCQMWPLLCA